MNVTIKKINVSAIKEYMVLIDKKTIAVCFTKVDAKFLARCIRKYKDKNRS